MAQRLALFLISLYQRAVSPFLPNCCRFEPSCSEYAAGAIRKYGFLGGTPRAAWRILRCNPLHRGGFDPVK
jgi:putative membrane protein insertion efficiency factor